MKLCGSTSSIFCSRLCSGCLSLFRSRLRGGRLDLFRSFILRISSFIPRFSLSLLGNFFLLLFLRLLNRIGKVL